MVPWGHGYPLEGDRVEHQQCLDSEILLHRNPTENISFVRCALEKKPFRPRTVFIFSAITGGLFSVRLRPIEGLLNLTTRSDHAKVMINCLVVLPVLQR